MELHHQNSNSLHTRSSQIPSQYRRSYISPSVRSHLQGRMTSKRSEGEHEVAMVKFLCLWKSYASSDVRTQHNPKATARRTADRQVVVVSFASSCGSILCEMFLYAMFHVIDCPARLSPCPRHYLYCSALSGPLFLRSSKSIMHPLTTITLQRQRTQHPN